MDDAYYSALEKSLNEAPMNSAPLQGWMDYLQGAVNRGDIKADELKWTDLPDKLREAAEGGRRLDKDTVMEIAEAAAVVVDAITVDGCPAWEVYAYEDTYVYDTEEEAWDEYHRQTDYLQKGKVVQVRHDSDNIVVYDDMADEQIEHFQRKHLWMIGNIYRDKAEAKESLQSDVSFYNREYPENAPHRMDIDEEEMVITISSNNGEVVATWHADEVWQNSAGQLCYSFESALRDANIVADNKIDYYLGYLSEPRLDEDGDIRDGTTTYGKYSFAPLGGYPYSETLLTLRDDTTFVSGHWPVGNVLAHIRTTQFWDDDDTKTLFVEELQSDWAQAKRGSAYVAHAPFVDSTKKWLNLALKKVLHQAVEAEADRIAIINGAQSAQRYRLEQAITEVQLFVNDNKYHLALYDEFGNAWRPERGRAYGGHTYIGTVDDEDALLAKLGKIIGKEVAKRLLAQEPRDSHCLRELNGVDLTIGGEGMKTFYDEIVPATLKALLKKLDPAVEIESVYYRATCQDQIGFYLTDEIREKVAEGQTLFSFSPRTLTAKAPAAQTFGEAKAYLESKLGKEASRLIKLTEYLPNGEPLAGEGVHIRGSADGKTCINPNMIHALYDESGKEVLSRDERLLWVAHHELFHRGVSVIGAENLRAALEAADRNPFVRRLADAIAAERRMNDAPTAMPRSLAVEEALAELHAAREGKSLPALVARYKEYAPDLELPITQGGWRARIHAYIGSAQQILSRLCGREVALNDAQVFSLVDRIGQQAGQEILPSKVPANPAHPLEKTPIQLPDLRGMPPREVGKVVYTSLSGDLTKLPQIKSELAKHGYQVDERTQ